MAVYEVESVSATSHARLDGTIGAAVLCQVSLEQSADYISSERAACAPPGK